ncbi:MAG: glycosyltransferase family 4 protein [Bacteroidetes bacterium]|nr:glycosyltransferase family 4 protein [Bacteroidota bacterium]
MKQNSCIIHVMGGFNNPIVKSQVLNWISLLEDSGVSSDIVSCVPVPGWIIGRKAENKSIREFKMNYKGKIYLLPVFRLSDKYNLISQWIKVFMLSAIIRKKLKDSKDVNIVLQTRSRFNYGAFRVLKKKFPFIKIVFDLRGAGAVEYLDSKGYHKSNELKDPAIYKEYFDLIDKESKMIRLSDIAFCVSDNMKSYLEKGDYSLNTENVVVVPGAADEEVFHFDKNIRAAKRAELGITEKTTFIYSGGLKNFYQKKDLVFEFAARLLKEDSKTVFICLTKDLGMVPELARKYQIDPDRMIVKFIKDPREVNAFLNAADLGLIFRDNMATNLVSSPTKAAEYLLAGIPLMISQNVGDYSAFIEKHKMGVVVDNILDHMMEAYRTHFNTLIPRDEISRISNAVYSKQANLQKILTSYEEKL